MKKFRITLEGKTHEVTVEVLASAPSPVTTPVATLQPSVAAAPAEKTAARPDGDEAGEVRSPLAGKLVSLDVKVGQVVDEGAQVATIEAMKMNTYVFAPKAGPVAALIARPGEAVDEHDVLLIIE